jgi:hypothetical protein
MYCWDEPAILQLSIICVKINNNSSENRIVIVIKSNITSSNVPNLSSIP